MKHLWMLLMCSTLYAQFDLPYRNNETPEYHEVINYYRQLDSLYEQAVLLELESYSTDCGKPLHLFLFGADTLDNDVSPEELRRDKTVLLINNGIHPGESCGIDASLLLARDLLQEKEKLPADVLIAIIPVYNIGGALNRNSHSRANQHGPEEHGFRGNARNLDLNRDFIKADAANTRSFYRIFHHLKPHIFVDTHTSNGADYQYTMTLLSTQKDKLNPVLAGLLTSDLEPFLYRQMKERNWEMTPYVNVFGTTPDKGFSAFMDSPRYATGYTSLFNTIGFTTEAHMLKPYEDRVEATYAFLETVLEYMQDNAEKLQKATQQAWGLDSVASHFNIDWKLDSSIVGRREFKGYEYEYVPSKLGNYQRLKYLNKKLRNYEVDYYPAYSPKMTVDVPRYYVLPRAWSPVQLLLQYNGVELEVLQKDSLISGMEYRIEAAEFTQWPYEGHHPIKSMKVVKEPVQRQFYAGDFLVPMNRGNQRFITAVLEPEARDSYLRWNFFDEIFQQKEYFSAYVFEDTAIELLKKDKELKAAFEEWKAANPDKLDNPYATLGFIYRNSKYYEQEHMRYPVLRVE